MIPVGFNPDDFRNNWFVLQDGLILTDYTNEELVRMFNWNCTNIARTIINLTAMNARIDNIDVNEQCLMTAEFALGNSLYILQYNLIGDGIETANKGVQGMKYITPAEWKRAWSKSAVGDLLAQIQENTGYIEGHSTPYMFGSNGISG